MGYVSGGFLGFDLGELFLRVLFVNNDGISRMPIFLHA